MSLKIIVFVLLSTAIIVTQANFTTTYTRKDSTFGRLGESPSSPSKICWKVPVKKPGKIIAINIKSEKHYEQKITFEAFVGNTTIRVIDDITDQTMEAFSHQKFRTRKIKLKVESKILRICLGIVIKPNMIDTSPSRFFLEIIQVY